MNKSRPKYCVGERVAIVSVLRPDYDCPSTEIIGIEYHEEIRVRDIIYTGWIYQVASNSRRWCEPALRKLPPDPENSFESLVGKLTEKDTEDAVA